MWQWLSVVRTTAISTTIYYMAEEMADKDNRPDLLNRLYSKMAYLFLHHNMHELAKTYATYALDYCKAKKDTLGMIQALRYICKSYQHVPGNEISNLDAHEVLAHIAIHQGQREAADEHFSKYKELNDALNRIQNSEAVAQMDAFYHNQKQSEENARLRFENSHKQNVIVIVIACLVVLVILFGTYIQRHRRRQELMALRIQQLEELKQAYDKTNESERNQTEQSIRQTAIYQRLATMEESAHPSDADWQALADAVNQAYPQFTPRLLSLCRMTTHEHHVCLLLKAGFEPVRIASLTLRSKAAVSTVRSRLYEKAFGKKGSAKDWDKVIRTL